MGKNVEYDSGSNQCWFDGYGDIGRVSGGDLDGRSCGGVPRDVVVERA